VRFGLLGTGPWAARAQAPALAAHPGVEFVGIWGRDEGKADALARDHQVKAYPSVPELLADVEAVAIALPPDVQAARAVQAATAGKHLLLDKPVALTLADSRAVVDAVDSAGVRSVVFFTRRFCPTIEGFLDQAATIGGWDGGRHTLFSSIFVPGNDFGRSPWRRSAGGLWDVGPHGLSMLLPVLGPVERVSAVPGPRDTTHVTLTHAGGAVSTMALSLDAAPAAARYETVFFGDQGWRAVPPQEAESVTASRNAISALLGGVDRRCDVHFGHQVVAILAAAEQARDTGTSVPVRF
jgi:predicted dehydrogenase